MLRFKLLARMVAFAAVATQAPGAATRQPPLEAPGGGEFMIVGTIHGRHLVEPAYPLGLLCRLVRAYRPDLVLVEIRPEPFGRGHYEDGPFEMTYITFCARSQGVTVEPIDWWRDEDLNAKQTALPPDVQGRLSREEAADPEPTSPLSFERVNSPEFREGVLRRRNIEERYDGDPGWTMRQAWFNHQAWAAIERHAARRVLAFVGYAHAPEVESYLRFSKLDDRSPLSLKLGQVSNANEPAPPAVVGAWREGIQRLQALAEAATGAARRRLQAKARYFGLAVARKGACCAKESDLAPPGMH